MRILFITQFFYPDIQATSKIFHELCEDLAKKHEVRVLSGMPLVEPRRGFSDPPRQEVMDGISVLRVGTSRNVKKSILDRVANHFTYFINAFFRIFSVRDCDVVVFTSDNPLNVLLALLLPGRTRIYLNQDLYAEQASRTGAVKGILFWLLKYLQGLSYSVADRIVVIGESMKKYLVSEKRFPGDRITVIANWGDVVKLKPVDKKNGFSAEHGLADKFVVMHSGRLGITQNLELLVRCAAELKGYEDIVFLIIGEGAKKTAIKKLAKDLSPGNIKFLHYQHAEILPQVFSAADIAVILYNCHLSHSLVPSRLFSFMACACPVIASIDPACSAAKIITNSGCGSVIGIGDLVSLKENILRFYRDPELRARVGSMGRTYVERFYSRDAMTGKYLNLLKELAPVKEKR